MSAGRYRLGDLWSGRAGRRGRGVTAAVVNRPSSVDVSTSVLETSAENCGMDVGAKGCASPKVILSGLLKFLQFFKKKQH